MHKKVTSAAPVVAQVAGVLTAAAGLLMLTSPAWTLLVAGLVAVALGTLAEMRNR